MDRLDYDKVYFKDKILITGHTPTALIDYRSRGVMWRGNNHIAIDCSVAGGLNLGCLCLDTMEEYYT